MLIKTVRYHHSYPALEWLKWTLLLECQTGMSSMINLSSAALHLTMRIWYQISFANPWMPNAKCDILLKGGTALEGNQNIFLPHKPEL